MSSPLRSSLLQTARHSSHFRRTSFCTSPQSVTIGVLAYSSNYKEKKKALRIRVIATEQEKKKKTSSHIHNRTLGRRRLVIYFRRARLICIERCLSRVAALMKLGRGAPRPLGEVLFRRRSNTLMPNAFCQLTPRRVCVTSRSKRGATS